MSDCRGPVHLRPMTPADVAAVTAVGAASMPDSWPAAAYEQDLTTNPNAHYFVACLGATVGEEGPPAQAARIVGFGGLWMMFDEAHIAALAVLPQCRRRRIGERLLVRILWRALEAGAVEVTLEVRESNGVARGLYAKYGFRTVGGRKSYYPDRGEDALIMTTPDVADPDWLAHFEALSRALDLA